MPGIANPIAFNFAASKSACFVLSSTSGGRSLAHPGVVPVDRNRQLDAERRFANVPTSDQMPTTNLWSAPIEATRNLERSLAANKRRALIQMATGSGKTYTTVNFVYRVVYRTGMSSFRS